MDEEYRFIVRGDTRPGLYVRHWFLFKAVILSGMPRELASEIVYSLYCHEIYVVIEDALVHGWRMGPQYLRAPLFFECRMWSQRWVFSFNHPRLGLIWLSDLLFDDSVRRTGCRAKFRLSTSSSIKCLGEKDQEINQ
jgi:hypothetical protein